MIKKVPIIDISGQRIIEEYKKSKVIKIDLRKIPKENITLTFNFNKCYFDKDGYFEAEGNGIIFLLARNMEIIKVATFKANINKYKRMVSEEGIIISKIKKLISNVTGLRWLQNKWNKESRISLLSCECKYFEKHGSFYLQYPLNNILTKGKEPQ